ncbi:MAG: Rrf2 family transcriptional regulator [Spirochaetales bacterium]
MKLSAKSRYGLRAMYYLGKNTTNEPLSLKTLATFSGVSAPYLEKLLGVLRVNNLIKTTRGINGGYELSRGAENISVGDIIRALEGEVLIVDCLDGCTNTKCPNKAIFSNLYDEINKVLDNTSLKSMIENN